MVSSPHPILKLGEALIGSSGFGRKTLTEASKQIGVDAEEAPRRDLPANGAIAAGRRSYLLPFHLGGCQSAALIDVVDIDTVTRVQAGQAEELVVGQFVDEDRRRGRNECL